jgi:hypothetical protein
MIWVDSDNIISTENVMRLLKHDVDIVGAWYRMHNSLQALNENNRTACGLWKIENGYSKIRPFTVSEIPNLPRDDKGLIEVDYAGFGLMVIKKGVFESISYPWFRSWVIDWKDDEGHEMADIMTDDSGFCFRAKEKGFKVYIDPDCHILHDKRVCV